jgi:translocation and assembly module TamA
MKKSHQSSLILPISRHGERGITIKMVTKFCQLLFLAGCLQLLGAKNAPNYQINGVKGDVLLNVQSRLNELYEQKPIHQEPPAVLQEQISKAMSPYGYFRASIAIAYTGSGVLIDIHPGPQMRIASLRIDVTGDGKHNQDLLKTLHELPIHAGDPFNNKLYNEAKDNLFSSAEHQGFLHATFQTSEVHINLDSYRADIILVFNTGPQFYFGQLHFDPTYISPELLHRYVPFKMGEAYSTDKLLAFNNNLSASGYFKSVVVKPQIKDNRDVPIYVHMQRAHRINYSYSVGYGTDTGPRGRVGMHVTPVNRWGHKFNAIAQGSMKENALLAQYLIPGRNPVTDKYNINGSLANLNYSSGYSNSALVSFGQQHIVNNFQRAISINGLHERYHYTDEPRNTKSLVFPKANLTWRNVSDPLFSPTGYNFSFSALAANKAFLSEVNMTQAILDAKAAIMVEPLRTRFYFHGIQGGTQIKEINNLPLSIAMLLGGSENLKGYGYDSIGPGRILSFVGVEVQKETFKKWYVVGSYDTGDVYNPSFRNFKHDVGLGLMWVSPIGPIKVGVAQAVDNHLARIKDRNPKLVVNMGPDI